MNQIGNIYCIRKYTHSLINCKTICHQRIGNVYRQPGQVSGWTFLQEISSAKISMTTTISLTDQFFERELKSHCSDFRTEYAPKIMSKYSFILQNIY